MIQSADSALASELLEVQRTLGWMDVVIGNISDAVFVTDESDRLVFVNQAFADLLSTPRVFLLGVNVHEVFDIKLKENPQKEFLADGSGIATSDQTKHRSQNIYDWEGPDKPRIFKISRQHISTIKQNVQIAKDITTEYEQSVIKTNFINIASHQLRTPMTAIMTYAHILHDGYAGGLDSKQEKLAGTIVDASERMIRLINDILLITRIQNGEADLKESDTTLKAVLTNLELELQAQFSAKSLNFSTRYAHAAEDFSCNRFITHEILSSLLTNAVQYTPDGGKVSVSADTTGGRLKLRVEDTGIGIPEDYKPKIYDQFSRAPNAFETFNEGTGLGLYVVKMLLDQVEGKVVCKSELNQGTTFTVTF